MCGAFCSPHDGHRSAATLGSNKEEVKKRLGARWQPYYLDRTIIKVLTHHLKCLPNHIPLSLIHSLSLVHSLSFTLSLSLSLSLSLIEYCIFTPEPNQREDPLHNETSLSLRLSVCLSVCFFQQSVCLSAVMEPEFIDWPLKWSEHAAVLETMTCVCNSSKSGC